MKLFNISKQKSKAKFQDADGNPIILGNEYVYSADIISETLELILNKKECYGTIQYIRQLIGNIYSSNTYEVHLFSMISNADEDHKELIFNILETLRYNGTRFEITNKIAPLVIETFVLDEIIHEKN